VEHGAGNQGASDVVGIVLIVLGVLLLVAALPLLFMSGMMGMMMGGGMMGGLLAQLVLVAGVALLAAGIWRWRRLS
jgi:hypothetical protein